MLHETAEERYENLLRSNPDIFQHAPLKQIASYLGITHTSLSRIRKDISRSATARNLSNDKWNITTTIFSLYSNKKSWKIYQSTSASFLCWPPCSPFIFFTGQLIAPGHLHLLSWAGSLSRPRLQFRDSIRWPGLSHRDLYLQLGRHWLLLLSSSFKGHQSGNGFVNE